MAQTQTSKHRGRNLSRTRNLARKYIHLLSSQPYAIITQIDMLVTTCHPTCHPYYIARIQTDCAEVCIVSHRDEHEHYSNRANWLRAAVLGTGLPSGFQDNTSMQDPLMTLLAACGCTRSIKSHQSIIKCAEGTVRLQAPMTGLSQWQPSCWAWEPGPQTSTPCCSLGSQHLWQVSLSCTNMHCAVAWG